MLGLFSEPLGVVASLLIVVTSNKARATQEKQGHRLLQQPVTTVGGIKDGRMAA